MQWKEYIVEIRKEIIYKWDFKSEYIIVLVILLEWKKVDNNLQKMKWNRGTDTKYILFKNDKVDTRFGTLFTNFVNNIVVRCAYVKNIDLLEEVICKEKQIIFKKIVLVIKINRSQLFISVEKGVKKHKNSTFLLINKIYWY